jgi:hypothetical protein
METGTMRTGRLFWGVFFLTTGVVLLLERMGGWEVTWSLTWKLWPVVIILLGIAMIFRSPMIKTVFAGVAGIVLALTTASMFSLSWVGDGGSFERAGKEQTFREEFTPTSARAEFTLDSGAGVFTVEDTTSALITARTRSSIGEYALEHTSAADRERVRLHLPGSSHGVRLRNIENRVEVQLNPKPVWDMNMNVGAARLDMDLTPFAVETISLDAGAASISMTLGDRASETHMSIDAGASSIRIHVPESVGCQARIQAPLTSKRFPGFEKKEKGVYETENFSSAKKKIYIEIDAGVSSIRVERY